jgi:hypothetical protein
MRAGFRRYRQGGRYLMLLVALGLGAALASGAASSGRETASVQHDHESAADTAAPAAGTGLRRAGMLQHAPTNLGGMLAQPARPARTTRHLRGKATSAAALHRQGVMPMLAAVGAGATPPAPKLVSKPRSKTAELRATFAYASPTATSYECRLDSASFRRCASPKAYRGPLKLGKHRFRVRARNAHGVGPARVYAWTITTPGRPTITAKPPATTTDRTAAFGFMSSHQGVTFQCRLDGASFSACVSPKGYSNLSLGSHTFRVRARNARGTGPAAVYSWTITGTPTPLPPPALAAPTLTSTPANPTFERNATFAFSSAGATGYQCQLDTTVWTACGSPQAYAGPLGFGSHDFRVRAVNATSTSPATSFTWTIGLAAPTINTGPAMTTEATSASFTFSHGQQGVGYQCRLDTAAFAACGSPANYSTLAVGAHTFEVRAVSGATTSAAASKSWTILAAKKPVKMRILVVSADGNETDLPAIQAFLRQLGVPFTTLIATQTTLTPQLLVTGATGNYQGVILTTGNLTHNAAPPGQPENWISAFTPEEWQTLWSYEAAFKVRQVTSFTFPFGAPDDYGLNLVTQQDTLTTPLTATLSTAGRAVFPYLHATNPVTFKGAWVYLATKRDANVTPLLTTSNGYVIASTRTYTDGRENLAVTAANNPFLLHSQLLSYGLINWVTRGVFLGERHVSVNVQIDDLLIESDMWDVNANTDTTGLRYRLDGPDFQNIVNWQSSIRSRPNFGSFRMEWAFNGEGADPEMWEDDPLTPNGDTLTPAVRNLEQNFNFVTHTLTHANLDAISYADAALELTQNHQWALNLGLTNYDTDAMVQPDISGLANPNFQQAAFDYGIRYFISDASRPEWSNPTPNAGFYSQFQPQILIIPRRANNLFYSLRTPTEWVDEYNWFYWLGSPSTSPWKIWPTEQTFAQIVDHESNDLLSYMMRWDLDPWMFHQANLGRYSGNDFLLGDLLEATFDKYAAVYNLPVRNLTQKQAGELMARRMTYDASGVDGTLTPCENIKLTVANTAVVPLTGAASGTTETYGGQTISNVPVTAGTVKTIPVTC